MGQMGIRRPDQSILMARGVLAVATCLVLANCASSGKFASRVDPKYGVSSSPRVVAFGEPVPKGGGTGGAPRRRRQTKVCAGVAARLGAHPGVSASVEQAGSPVNRRDSVATIDSPRRVSPHFRRLRDAISSCLDAEVGCIGAL